MGSCWSKLKKKCKPSNSEHARSVSRSLKKSDIVQYDPKILILGAGVAGLACAVELKSRGFNNVRIVEMSDRIGGRIKTIKFADNYIDLGAQWVYGQRGNVVYKMVKRFNELGRSDNMLKKMDWIRSNGDKVPRSVVEQMLNLITNIYTEMQGERIDPQATFGEYLSKMFEREVERRNIDLDWPLANEFIHAFKKMEGNMSDSDISAYNYWSYKPCEGGGLLNWRDKGFKQYLRHLVKGDELNEHGVLKDCIDLNQKAIEIEWDRLDGAVHVKCENKKYIVDHAVITVSLGVLKHSTTLFQPPLPDPHCKAINCMGFGSVCKILIEFEEKFWPDDWHGFNALWRKGDTPTDHWLKDIYCFHVYDYQPRVLLGWACGLEVEVIETIDHIALVEGIVHMLQRFLPNFRLPHLTNVKISKWGIDPAHYGSYSYPSVIASENNTGPSELAQPINKIVYESRRSSNTSASPRSTLTAATMAARPVLFFAGEATSSDHYSTVHGAVETGIREANRIVSFYDRPSTYAVYYNSSRN